MDNKGKTSVLRFCGVCVAAIALAATMLMAQEKKSDSSAQAAAGAETYKNAAKYTFGQSRADLAAIEAEIRAAAPAQYAAIEDKLLAALADPQAMSDAKRYFCRMLAAVGSAKCVPALAALLGDEQLSDPVRIALEPMAEEAAGAALRDALGKVKGKQLAGVIASIGVRRDAQAVAALAALTGNSDVDVARAAVRTLGEIGTADAAKALGAAEAGAKVLVGPRVLAKAKIACAARLAKSGQAEAAGKIYRSLLDSAVPGVSVAAMNGLLAAADRPQAAAMLIEKLQGKDAKMKSAAVQALCTLADKDLKAAVLGQLNSLEPATQAMLLTAVVDQADVPVRTAVLKVLAESKDEALRLAALECLAVHGETADVALLVATAAGTNSAEAACAGKVLKVMRAAGANDALLKMLESSDAGKRPAVIAALEARKVVAALPVLARMVASSDASAAADAAKALSSLGTDQELPAMLAAMVATGDDKLRGAIENAAGNICTRAEDKTVCSQAVLGCLEKAQTPSGKAACLRLLPRVKTAAALAALRQALKDSRDEVSEAAVRALADWPDMAAAPILLDLARTISNDRYAIVALQGCLRLAGAHDRTTADALSLYRGVLETARRVDEKKQALAGLGNLSALESAELIRKCLKDASLANDAATAGVRLARALGPVDAVKAQSLLEEIKQTAGLGDGVRKTVDEALVSIKDTGRADGYVIAWMLSGPYTKQGKGCTELFDEAFAPEKAGAAGAAWKLATIPGGSGPRILHIDKILGGNDRVAYVKTCITSAKDQEITLETGSDDGIKVWLNGEVVLSKNVVRPCQPGQDRAKVKLKQGPNAMLVKVTQGGGEWEVCVRLRTNDNKDVDGITVSPLEK